MSPIRVLDDAADWMLGSSLTTGTPCVQVGGAVANTAEIGWDALSSTRRVEIRQRQRTERRAEKMRERRARRRWAVLSVAILAGSFGLTVGILDVLR